MSDILGANCDLVLWRGFSVGHLVITAPPTPIRVLYVGTASLRRNGCLTTVCHDRPKRITRKSKYGNAVGGVPGLIGRCERIVAHSETGPNGVGGSQGLWPNDALSGTWAGFPFSGAWLARSRFIPANILSEVRR